MIRCAYLIFTDPKKMRQSRQPESPTHKLRYSPRKICSENSIVKDVYSADVAYRKVSHCYKKGVSENENTENQIIMHDNTLNFVYFPSFTPHM